MSHAEVYKAFRQYFPTYVGENIAAWFPNGRNSIRVREANGDEFIFSFNNGKDWKFATIDSFLNGKKGEKRNGGDGFFYFQTHAFFRTDIERC